MKITIDVTIVKTTAGGIDFNESIRQLRRSTEKCGSLYLVETVQRKDCTILLVGGIVGNLRDELIIAASGVCFCESETHYQTEQKAEEIAQIISAEEYLALELLDADELSFY